MFGIPLGPLTVADGAAMRNNGAPEDMSALQKALAEVRARNHTPNGRVARGWDQFAPMTGAAPPMLPTPPTPPPVDMSEPSLKPAMKAYDQGQANPMDAQALARPPAIPVYSQNQTNPMDEAALAAPQGPPTPDMGFFARNTAMMKDPTSGDFLDPMNAQRAQASGPDVINKLLSYFHNKDNA